MKFKFSVPGFIVGFIASVIVTLALSCPGCNSEAQQDEPVAVKRMGVVDSIYTKQFNENHYQSFSFRLYVIRVDDKEYIVNSRGGIVEHKHD